MATPKIIVIYPQPRDMDAFERAYNDEHLPLAGRIFQAAGATKAVFTKVTASTGAPAFHRIAEIHFPSTELLQACAAGPGQEALAHALKISSGGAPVVLIAEEDTVPLA